MVKVQDLKIGDQVDLEFDMYANPDGNNHFEYKEVESVEKETDNCIRVDFVDFYSVGFPVDHFVSIK